jgi:hypothetical protein
MIFEGLRLSLTCYTKNFKEGNNTWEDFESS